MPRLCYHDSNFDENLSNITKSFALDDEVSEQVLKILNAVRKNGDKALIEFTEKWDQCKLDPTALRVSSQALDKALQDLNPDDKSLFQLIEKNLIIFHKEHIAKSWQKELRPGASLGKMIHPLDRVGIYIPGGTAPLISTVFMTVIPAKVAGVKEIVLCSPPNKKGKIHPLILAAAEFLGVKEVYSVGGAQAIGAMAFGTKSILPVHKIVGPGNAYIAMAKKLVVGVVDIDMIAGPSEILVLADEKAKPEWVAADLLSQAEHDVKARMFLVSNSLALLDQVENVVITQLKKLKRKKIAKQAWQDNGWLIHAENLVQAINIANAIAPEHLELMIESPHKYLSQLKSAGAIFVGPYTPEAVGDYVAGPSHVLPTGGSARFYSPLSVNTFLKETSVLEYDKSLFLKEAPWMEKLAELEGLGAHKNSISIRINQ